MYSFKMIAFRVLAILALVGCVASLIDHLRPVQPSVAVR